MSPIHKDDYLLTIIWTTRKYLRSNLNRFHGTNLSLLHTKALWKAEYSDFCIFAKFEKCFIPYILYILNISCQNRFAKFHKNMIKLMKCKFKVKNVHFVVKNICFEAKNVCLESKNVHFEVRHVCFELFRVLQNSKQEIFCTYGIYCINIKFLISRKNHSNSNSDLNIWLRVRNAGPYYVHTCSLYCKRLFIGRNNTTEVWRSIDLKVTRFFLCFSL